MSDDELMQDRDPGDETLARRLEAYGAERLTPELAAITRMRAQVMAAADRRAALVRADAAIAATVAATSAVAVTVAATSAVAATMAVPTPLRHGRRRLVGALLAACLTVGLVVGSALASQAGGPLYPVRIWAETVTLPSSSSERATAEVRRLEARLAEASAASAAGDLAAADAALEAYGNIVVSATTEAGADLAAGAILDTGAKHNVTVLTTLAGRVPEPAREAIQRAIQRSGAALDRMHVNNGNQRAPKPAPVPPATQTPATTPAPDTATPKPERTPKPASKPSAPASKPSAPASKPSAPASKPDQLPPARGG